MSIREIMAVLAASGDKEGFAAGPWQVGAPPKGTNGVLVDNGVSIFAAYWQESYPIGNWDLRSLPGHASVTGEVLRWAAIHN